MFRQALGRRRSWWCTTSSALPPRPSRYEIDEGTKSFKADRCLDAIRSRHVSRVKVWPFPVPSVLLGVAFFPKGAHAHEIFRYFSAILSLWYRVGFSSVSVCNAASKFPAIHFRFVTGLRMLGSTWPCQISARGSTGSWRTSPPRTSKSADLMNCSTLRMCRRCQLFLPRIYTRVISLFLPPSKIQKSVAPLVAIVLTDVQPEGAIMALRQAVLSWCEERQ